MQRLNVMTWGEADTGAPALLLHGITSNAGSWIAVGPALADAGYRVLAPDMLGHGRSPKPATGYDWDALVESTVAVTPAHLDLVVGHSLGGALALRAIADGRLSADRLVLEDPALTMASPQHAIGLLDAVRELPTSVAELQQLNPHWSPDDASERSRALLALDWAAAEQIFAGNAPWDFRGLVATVARTTEVVYVLPPVSDWVGESDRAEAVQAVGESQVIVVPGTGHSIHRDDPEAFLAILRPRR